MHFKELELIGFKSFADRTLLRLEPGITAIVGPNGCGKSNILDALRWVLGEQRARELRGSHMQDVVFNGSESRQPLGMAEVSVTFDNSDNVLPVDFSEVRVTRRVYRSGESEYLINKAPCRLRDIHELFMDTGIGTEAYSMVGQGKMDLILSSKPEDRRYLFEEAAGIIKYKTRKRLAVRRLESAEQNLLRLGDIIAEVQRQMRSLKRQVNAAIRYREISEQLRGIEIRAAWIEFRRLIAETEELRECFRTSADAFEEISARISTLEARHETVALDRLEAERERLARQQRVYEIDAEMEKIERRIALLRQQAEYAAEREAQAESERRALLERAQTLAGQAAATDDRAVALHREADDCAAAVQSKTDEHARLAERVTQADAALELVRARAASQASDKARAQTALESLNESVAEIDRRLETLYAEQERLRERQSELLSALESARREQTEKHEALAQTDDQRTALASARAKSNQTLRDLEEIWRRLREENGRIEARLASLRELRDTYEGFAAGVRAIMSARANGEVRDVIGPVGDLLSTDQQYERAIEAALGGNINNVIVETADAAKDAIEYLKRNTAGRVTFLPLDTIRGGMRDDVNALAGEPGVIGPAIQVARFDARLRPAVEYLLHSTVLVHHIDDAIRITRSRPSHPRLVTLEGEVVSSAGAVTGGRTKYEGRGLLGRSAEIVELEQRGRDLAQQVTEIEGRRASALDGIEAQQRELEAIDAALSALRLELGEIGIAIARHNAEIENLAETVRGLDRQRHELSARRDQLEQQRADALRRRDSMQSADEAVQAELAAAQDAASEARRALSTCAGELADLRVRHASLLQRVEEIDRDRQRESRERDLALAEARQREESIANLREERQAIERESVKLAEESRHFADAKDEAARQTVRAQERLQQLLDEGDALDKELKRLREQAKESQAEVHRIELQLRQNEDRAAHYRERIADTYGVDLATLPASEVGTDEYTDEQRADLVAELRGRLQKMGEVNLGAIDEYTALEQREAFLTSQSNDLHQAREALLGVIQRSDKRIREMFLETFEKVSEYFGHYFRRLFHGGQARIYLIDEDDPLESGIEIEARPPGKKPTSISLLSGGESAMTAVALLFAIFKAKPSPFCVLDEVDAPLDDANIGRFVALLEEFTDQSQIVVITHNKQTMARADALYGVTMKERGVSQLVSVKLNGK